MFTKHVFAGLVAVGMSSITIAGGGLWGVDDESGASNWITPTKVLSALDLVDTGQIYELGRVYERAMPLFGTRTYKLTIPGSPTGGPIGDNKLIFHDELLTSEVGQVGTQFDGLGHIGKLKGNNPDNKKKMLYYNGFTEREIATAEGLVKLGIEKIKPIITRGVLIDMVAFRGRPLNAGEEITLADVLGALDNQRLVESDIQPGDAVLFHTGWGAHWITDNVLYNSGAPGIGLEVADWLVEKQIALAGADTWPVEVVPNPNPKIAFQIHQRLLRENGIFLHENLDLSELADQQVYQFAYIFVRVPFKGATGSPGSPIAVN